MIRTLLLSLVALLAMLTQGCAQFGPSSMNRGTPDTPVVYVDDTGNRLLRGPKIVAAGTPSAALTMVRFVDKQSVPSVAFLAIDLSAAPAADTTFVAYDLQGTELDTFVLGTTLAVNLPPAELLNHHGDLTVRIVSSHEGYPVQFITVTGEYLRNFVAQARNSL